MIIVNKTNKKFYKKTWNMTEVARIIGYNERTIRRWVEIFKVKAKIHRNWIIYFDESIYEKGKYVKNDIKT